MNMNYPKKVRPVDIKFFNKFIIVTLGIFRMIFKTKEQEVFKIIQKKLFN